MHLLWQHIADQIQPQILQINNIQSVSGGDINQSYLISGLNAHNQKVCYFVKLNAVEFYDMFEQESLGLVRLEQTNTITVPKVVSVGHFQSHCFLVLERLTFGKGKIVNFARNLAKLHLTSQPQGLCGFEQNNYIGTTLQRNDFNHDWGEFFAFRRLDVQLDLLMSRYNASWIKQAKAMLPDIANYLKDIHCKPCLVHGDLWQGNFAFNQQGHAVIYDPAVYYGDYEVDLAMLQLFGSLNDDFYMAYDEINPLRQDRENRLDLYNWYHILNHANLFSGHYLAQSKHFMELVKKLV